MNGLDLQQVLPLVAALAAGGVVMGFLAGLFGIGGGAIIVPVLYELFAAWGVPEDIRLKLATGTSLAIMLPTTYRAFRGHQAKGVVDLSIVKRLALPLVLGVVAGVLLAKNAPVTLFKAAWIVFGLGMGTNLMLGDRGWRLGTEFPKSKFFELYGFVVGCLSTLLSVAGGAFMTVMLKLYGRTITQAIGTASAFGPMITIPGALGFMWAGWGVPGLPPLSAGYVNLAGFVVAATTSVLAAPYGVKMAHRVPRRTLEIGFGCFLYFMAARFIVGMLK
ncbi:MAG: sulfite exporter TauE/SafE family protein [Hyphomicrobiaceae bacterium]